MKNFGRNPIHFFGSLFLASAWIFTTAAQAATPGAAQVKRVTGTATYADAKGGGPLKEGDVLMQGASITTGAGSYVDLFLGVNGDALRVEADSTLALNNLDYTKAGETIVNTQIEIKKGFVVAHVINKLSKASKYEIKTQAGIAGIRGTVLAAGASGPNLPPGLYVQVLDGMVRVSNSGGSQNFTSGQFGFTASFQQPPVVVPANPGMRFTPPPGFSSPAVPASKENGSGKGGTAQMQELARIATSLTANTVPDAVPRTVALFVTGFAANAAAEAGKAGGNSANSVQVAANTAKTVFADLMNVLVAQQADVPAAGRSAIQAIVVVLTREGDGLVAGAAAKGAGIAVKVNGGNNVQAEQSAKEAALQTTSDPTLVARAVEGSKPAISIAVTGGSPSSFVEKLFIPPPPSLSPCPFCRRLLFPRPWARLRPRINTALLALAVFSGLKVSGRRAWSRKGYWSSAKAERERHSSRSAV